MISDEELRKSLRPIKEVPGYLISERGVVYSEKGLSLKPIKTINNGASVTLLSGADRKSFLIRRLVIDAWGSSDDENLPEMRPIPGCLGYMISRNGTVYSNKTADRYPREVKPSANGSCITLNIKDGKRRVMSITKLVKSIWGDAPAKPKVKIPAVTYNPIYAVVDTFGNFIKG